MPRLTLSLANRCIELRAPAAWTDRVATAIRQIGPPRPQAPEPDLLVHVGSEGEPPLLPEASQQVTQYGERVRVHSLGHTRWVVTPGGVTTLDLTSDHAALWLDPEGEVDREVAAHLVVGLSLWLRSQGRDALHAAGLAQGDDAVLLVGPSDVGKSTLALNLVRAGWHALSDDTVLLYDSGALIQASGFRRSFALDALPEIDAPARPVPGDEAKWSVDLAAAFPDRFSVSATPRVLLFPKLTGEAISSVMPLSTAEAFLALAAQSALRELQDSHTRDQHERLSRLLGQAPAFRLAAGRDLLDADVADRLVRHTLARALCP